MIIDPDEPDGDREDEQRGDGAGGELVPRENQPPGELSEGQESTATPRGRKRRRDLAEWVDEDVDLTGEVDLMVSSGGFTHRLVLRGRALTSRGGPANEVFNLGAQATKSLKALFPGIEPQVATVAAGNSITIEFYAPDEEVEAANARRTEAARAQRTEEEEHKEDEEELGAEGLPDTSLAILVLAEFLSYEDPADAAEALRDVSVAAAEKTKALALTLAESGVELDMREVKANAHAEPPWATGLVEVLDAAAEVPPETVTVYGVLQGANSGGQGSFEIVTEATRSLDPALGRRSPGDKIKGTLTPKARKQIREANLWDTHVVARVQVSRERKGRSLRQRDLRLMSVKRLPASG